MGTPSANPGASPTEPVDRPLAIGGDGPGPAPTDAPASAAGFVGNGHPSPAETPAAATHATNGHVVTNGHALTNGHAATNGAPANVVGHDGQGSNGNGDRSGQCTAPQLRRFIKSRPYVPMHELRRRFGIIGADDDVTPVKLELGWVYVGLPSREGTLLGDLLRSGEIGYELSLDPRTPIVIGVYPMRPIPRN
jgi:hypothetical protein